MADLDIEDSSNKILYSDLSRYVDANGYVRVKVPGHPKAMQTRGYEGYVYEHVLVAERLLDRQLRPTEVVHHLDENRSNNSPDNILVLEGPMHDRLHQWMARYEISPLEAQAERMGRGCVRCQHCQVPIRPELKYCSTACQALGSRLVVRPSSDELKQDLLSSSFTKIGKKYDVSDVAVRKWCKQYGLPSSRPEVRKLREGTPTPV